MPKALDLKGKIFGRLTTLERDGLYWICQCSCKDKTIKRIKTGNLTSEKTKSCGCLSTEAKTKHGLSVGENKRIYKIYNHMIDRCYNENNKSYSNYGGRGISVCDEWLGDNGSNEFYNWSIKNNYSKELTIDRIKVNGNYEPSNCRWITNDEQQNNKRTNRLVTINDETKTMSQWCKEYNINVGTFFTRIDELGWTGEKLLSPPMNRGQKN